VKVTYYTTPRINKKETHLSRGVGLTFGFTFQFRFKSLYMLEPVRPERTNC
jgi:hypothetical protein